MLTIKDRLVDAALDDPKIYTMRELNQHTARVMDEINDNFRPAAITKHGRFVALIMPLRDAQIETTLLADGPLADIMDKRSVETDAVTYNAHEMPGKLDELYPEGNG
jgi:prevent-host-death family protein